MKPTPEPTDPLPFANTAGADAPLERDAMPTGEAAAAEAADRAAETTDPPPPGETGRELTGDEANKAVADAAVKVGKGKKAKPVPPPPAVNPGDPYDC